MTPATGVATTAPGQSARRGTQRAPGAERRAEFESLLVPILPRAYSAARYMTGDPMEAEDLVQEAALLAWRGFERFEPGTNFRAWFLTILTNLNYSRVRRASRRPQQVTLDALPDLYLYRKLGADTPSADDAGPAQALLRDLDVTEVRRAIEDLPDEFRTVAALYFAEDLSYRQIAEVVGCPVGTVRSRLHRGRKMLQVSLWRLAEEHGLVSPEDSR
jgi:RNA polymerase sigma-70 factor (ECF subfamily)